MKYSLVKISHPSFELTTHTLGHIHRVLSDFICTTCMKEEEEWTFEDETTGEVITCTEGLSPLYGDMSVVEQIDELLATPCGCEFFLEEEDV